jgi:uncharacterized delta-60 repeat protein
MNSQRFGIQIQRQFLLLCLMLFGLSVNSFAAPGDLDRSFRPAIGRSGGRDINYVLQPDGKILVIGEFTILGGEVKNKLARLNADGTLDNSFHPEVENAIYTYLFLQPDGKILINDFVLGFIRLNSDGSRDTNFNSSAKGTVKSVAFQSDGKLIIGGFFTVNNIFGVGVARLNTNGSIDETFNPVKFQSDSMRPPEVFAVLLAASGKIYVGGSFKSVNGVLRNGLIKLNSDGSLDMSFPLQFAAGVVVSKLGQQTDGKILIIGGGFPSLARINADDTIDESFAPPPPLDGYGIISFFLQSDGKILLNIAGGNINQTYVTRLNKDGTADSSFRANPLDGLVFGIAQDGKILSSFIENVSSGSNTFIKFSRLNSDGSLYDTFEVLVASGGTVSTILVQPDGKILVGGTFLSAGKQLSGKLTRLNQNGTVDTTFNINLFVRNVTALALQPDGKILVGGFFTPNINESGTGLVRLNTDGSRDSSFNLGVMTSFDSSMVSAIALEPGGKIYIGGSISYNGVSLRGFARLNSDGSLDTSFTLKPGFGVKQIIVQPDGKILVGGEMTSNGTGDFRFAIERLNPNNTIDTTFNNNLVVNNTTSSINISSLALLPNGKILYGTSQLKRLNPNGSEDETFSTVSASFPNNSRKEISRIVVQPDGKIVISGYFNGLMNSGSPVVNQAYIARLNPDGIIDLTFTPRIKPILGNDVIIPALAIEQNGGVLFGGNFESVNGIIQPALARLKGGSINSVPFDFDGDGKADVSVYRPENGVWYMLNSLTGFNAVQFGIASDKLVPADYDGDGKTDVAVFRDGTWHLQRSQAGFTAVQFGLASDIPAPADFDGDGKAEIVVFRPSTGVWHILNLVNYAFNAVQFGTAEDKPVAADYDGDGKADYAVYRPSNGVWYMLRSTQGFGAVQFGISTDKPVVGDYDGDGKADQAVYRLANGVWYMLRSSQGYGEVQFGISTDLPAPADYDGDGKTDVAIYRNGVLEQQTSSQGYKATQFGFTTDKPVPNAFVP